MPRTGEWPARSRAFEPGKSCVKTRHGAISGAKKPFTPTDPSCILRNLRRGDREADGARLESGCSESYRGFESPPLRHYLVGRAHSRPAAIAVNRTIFRQLLALSLWRTPQPLENLSSIAHALATAFNESEQLGVEQFSGVRVRCG